MELLTKPSLLFLDEPTSGLDPGSSKSVWETMRALADDGRTVIVVTQEVAHLDLCDRVLILVPLLEADGTVIAGGRVAYYGPPAGGLEFFGKPDWAGVFEAFQLLVGLTLSQIVLSGGARQLTQLMGLNQLSYVFPSRWAYAATASTLNLDTIGAGLVPDPRWRHTPATWFLDMGMLAALGMIIILVTWWLLIRSRPGPKR